MKPFRERSYYELLQVPVDASSDQIRSAYQRALERSTAGEGAVESEHLEELRDLLSRAAAVLTDPLRRSRYDESLRAGEGNTSESGTIQLAMLELLECSEGGRPPPVDRRDDGQRLQRRAPARHVASLQISPPRSVRSSKVGAELDCAPLLAEESAIANAEAALVHASARGEHLRNRPVHIPPDAIFCGDLLRRIREGRGLAVHEVAERTRIPLKHLENIESDRYNQLPATVYLRGILTSLSKELGVDPARVTKDYIQLASKGKR